MMATSLQMYYQCHRLHQNISPPVVSSKGNLKRPKTGGKRPRNIYSCSSDVLDHSDGNLIANTLSSASDHGLNKESLKRPQMGAKRPKKI